MRGNSEWAEWRPLIESMTRRQRWDPAPTHAASARLASSANEEKSSKKDHRGSSSLQLENLIRKLISVGFEFISASRHKPPLPRCLSTLRPMDPTNLPPRSTPHWSLYQREIFVAGTRDGKLPPFSTDPQELERLAKERLSAGGWSYASSNAGTSDTHVANREAFKQWRIIPRMLVDTNQRDTSVEIFGKKLSAPIAFSPVGINKIYHNEGELPVARVAGELGLPYSLSTAGSASIEDAGEHNVRGATHGVNIHAGAQDGNGLRYFQLYLPHDDNLAISLLERANNAGFEACIMT